MITPNREQLIIKWRIHKVSIITIVFLLILYVVLFHINIPDLMPLKNRPDEIIVYKNGEQATFTPDSKVFKDIYKRLRPCANSKIYNMLGTATAFSMKASEAMYMDKFLEYGVVVKVVYDETQHFWQEGYDNPYNNLYYVFSYPDFDKNSPQYIRDPLPSYIIYQDATYGQFLGITDTPSYKKAAGKYIESLELS